MFHVKQEVKKKKMSEYYDGTKVLSMKDKNGKQPELIFITSNRSAGKTTYFGRMLINRFIKHGKKFCLLYRYKYELTDVKESFFSEIGRLFFNDYFFETKARAKGSYLELYLIKKSDKDNPLLCGYAVPLNSSEQIRKRSHVFADVDTCLMDEFQSETNNYCADEFNKFFSVHMSIARGGGKQVRFVPVIMLSNCVTLLNPYYTALEISSSLKKDTKFYKGDGFVIEQAYNKNVAKKQEESAFARAFKNSKYSDYASQNIYLNDNYAFISTCAGKSRYLATIRLDNKDYAIREFADTGIIYCDNKIDPSSNNNFVITTDDHNVNYVMLKTHSFFIETMRYYFDHGCFRFKDLNCKNAVFKMLSY